MTPEERFERIEKDLELLAQYALKHEERLAVLDEKLIALADAQKETDERLNTLIGVVERYFSNGA